MIFIHPDFVDDDLHVHHVRAAAGDVFDEAHSGRHGAVLVNGGAGAQAGLVLRVGLGDEHQPGVDPVGGQAEGLAQGVDCVHQVLRRFGLRQGGGGEGEPGDQREEKRQRSPAHEARRRGVGAGGGEEEIVHGTVAFIEIRAGRPPGEGSSVIIIALNGRFRARDGTRFAMMRGTARNPAGRPRLDEQIERSSG